MRLLVCVQHPAQQSPNQTKILVVAKYPDVGNTAKHTNYKDTKNTIYKLVGGGMGRDQQL